MLATQIGNGKQNLLAVLCCRFHCKCAQERRVLKSSPQNTLMSILQEGLSTSTGPKKGLHINSKVRLTVHGNVCSSISRNGHECSLSTRHKGLHSLTYITTELRRMRRTPRHRHAKQSHEPPNEQVPRCCKYIGEVILD